MSTGFMERDFNVESPALSIAHPDQNEIQASTGERKPSFITTAVGQPVAHRKVESSSIRCAFHENPAGAPVYLLTHAMRLSRNA